MPRATRVCLVILLAVVVATAPAAGAAGDLQWSHDRHSSGVVDIETDSGLAVSADSGDVHADDAASGSQQWTFNDPSGIEAVSVRDGRVLVGNASGGNGGFWELDASDGSVTASTPERADGVTGVAATASSNYIIAAGNVELFDSGDTSTIQDTYVPPSSAAALTADADYAYVATADGAIEQLEASGGSIATTWRMSQTFDSVSALATNGDVLVAAGTDGNGNPTVAAYDRVDGALLWTHGHHSSAITDVSVGPAHVASSAGGTVLTARLSDGAQTVTHSQHSGSVEAVAMSDSVTVSGDSSSSNTVLAVENPARLSDPDPTDGRPASPVELNVTVTDPGATDSHTVRFYNRSNGNLIGSETLTGSGEASVSWDHNTSTASAWNATIEESATGATVDESGPHEFNSPQTLFIREELPPHDRITTDMNVTIRFFGEDDTIYERQASDGRLDLSGLPDRPFVVTIDPPNATDYTRRATYFRTTYERQTAYLLDTSATDTIESRFVLDDATGEFDPDSIIYIERPINRSGDLRWRTVAADQFGAEGVTVTLEEGKRYRVRLRNDAGSTQVVGPYRSDVSETVQVRPGAPTIELGEPIDGWFANATLDGQTLEYRFSDPSNLTDEVNISIYERGNKSNTLQPDERYQDLGSITKQTTLTQSESEKEWVVVFNVTRNGEEYTKKVYVSNGTDLVPGPVTREWRLIAAIMMLLISAGAFSVLNSGVGAVVVSLEGAVLYWTGWLAGATSAAAVAISLFLAMLVHIYKASGP